MMLTLLRSMSRDDAGATAIEYALIAGMVALVIIAGLTLTSGKVNALFNSVAGAV